VSRINGQSNKPEEINQKSEVRTSIRKYYSLPPLLPLPLMFPLVIAVPLVEPGLGSGAAGPGPGYACMMLARVAGTGGGDWRSRMYGLMV